jgi:hypothetical protein
MSLSLLLTRTHTLFVISTDGKPMRKAKSSVSLGSSIQKPNPVVTSDANRNVVFIFEFGMKNNTYSLSLSLSLLSTTNPCPNLSLSIVLGSLKRNIRPFVFECD